MLTRLPGVLRLLLAILLFARLGGLGRTWLPSALVLGGALAALLLAESARRVYRLRRASGLPGWRELATQHAFGLALGGIVLLALLARLPSIDADLFRQPMDIDEHRLSSNIKDYFVTGRIGYLTVEHYPGVLFWVLTAASMVAYLGGLMRGAFLSVQEMPVEHFLLAGRYTNVVIGAATVAFTGVLGRRVAGTSGGLIAAALMAVAPLAIQTTTSMRNDPGQVLLLVMASWAALRLHDTRDARWALAAGALAGLATAIKYTSVFAAAPALLASAFAPAAVRLRLAAQVSLALALALAITNHFLWYDVANFVRQLSDQVAITGPGHWAASANPPAVHVELMTRFGPGLPLLLAAAAWGVYGLASGNRVAWIFWLLPLLYSWFTTQRPSQLPRWVLPLFPFVSVAGAAGLMRAQQWLAGWGGWSRYAHGVALRRATAVLVGGAVLAPAAWTGAVAISRRLTPPTQSILETWLKESASSSTVVLAPDGWLNLREGRILTIRVPDLATVLAGDDHVMRAADWVVVPETHFAHPGLARLSLLKSVTAEQRSIGGNLGFDFRVYAVPRVPPVEGVEIALASADGAPYLGWQWDRGDRRAPGLLLPLHGASLFTPPLTSSRIRVAVDVHEGGSPRGDVPVTLAVSGRAVALAEDGAATLPPGVRRVAGVVDRAVAERGEELRLEAVRRSPLLRVVAVQVTRAGQ